MRLSNRSSNTSPWIRTFARFGLIAKGVVYSLSGMLALIAAMHHGTTSGDDASKSGVFNFIYELPLGKALLAAIAIGLLCYSVWRLIQGFEDTEHKGKDLKGLGERFVYVFSGIVYLSVAFYASKLVLTDEKKDSDGKQQLASELMDKPFGQFMMWIAAAIMIGSGVVQFYRALSGKYKKNVKLATSNDDRVTDLLITAGKIGYLARGIVWFVIGWLFIKAAYKASPAEAGGSGNALQWLAQWQYGNLLMGTVAAGLLCYGIFMFLRARYQPIHS